MIVFNLGRVVLFLLALKWIRVTKVFFYYELITALIEQMLPWNVSWTVACLIRLLVTIVNFVTDYFDFWPSLICLQLQYPVMSIFHSLFHNERVDGQFFAQMFTNMIICSLCVWVAHLSLAKCGMIYCEAEVLRDGNEQLLNNLEEGVMILEEDTPNILFLNQAAKKFQSRKKENSDFFEMSLLDEVGTDVATHILDQDLEMFAYLDP